jgi:hypothetical protein
MRKLIFMLLAAAPLAACTFPQTKMEPISEYGAAKKASYSSTPSYTAGPTGIMTTSPDGATAFACEDGSVRWGSTVPPGEKPAC